MVHGFFRTLCLLQQYHFCILSSTGTFFLRYMGQAFPELKMSYAAVVAEDFDDLQCEASAKSVAIRATHEL